MTEKEKNSFCYKKQETILEHVKFFVNQANSVEKLLRSRDALKKILTTIVDFSEFREMPIPGSDITKAISFENDEIYFYGHNDFHYAMDLFEHYNDLIPVFENETEEERKESLANLELYKNQQQQITEPAENKYGFIYNKPVEYKNRYIIGGSYRIWNREKDTEAYCILKALNRKRPEGIELRHLIRGLFLYFVVYNEIYTIEERMRLYGMPEAEEVVDHIKDFQEEIKIPDTVSIYFNDTINIMNDNQGLKSLYRINKNKVIQNLINYLQEIDLKNYKKLTTVLNYMKEVEFVSNDLSEWIFVGKVLAFARSEINGNDVESAKDRQRIRSGMSRNKSSVSDTNAISMLNSVFNQNIIRHRDVKS